VAAAVLADLSEVDARFELRKEQEQHNPEFWLSWALAALDALESPAPDSALAAAAAAANPASPTAASPAGSVTSNSSKQQQQHLKRPDLVHKAGSILLQGMAAHSSKPHLWLLHVQLLLRRAGFGLMQATVLQRLEGFCGSCYQLHLLAGNVQACWQLQAVQWIKAIAALTAAAGPAAAAAAAGSQVGSSSSGGSSSDADVSGVADCVLDVALRLVRCLCDAGAQELFVAWCEQLLDAAVTAAAAEAAQQQQCSFPTPKAVKEAVAAANGSVVALLKELDKITSQQQQQQGSQAASQQASAAPAGSAAAAAQMTAAASAVAHDILAASELGKLAVNGLVALTAQHPRHAAVLWMSLAHAAARGCLPTAVEAKLHYKQQLFVLTPAQLGLRGGAAVAAAAAAGDASQGFQLAGRLMQAAADSCILQQQQQKPAAGTSVQQQQQQHRAAATRTAAGTSEQQQTQQQQQQQDRAAAAHAVCGSLLSLQPYWRQLGITDSPLELACELTVRQQVLSATQGALPRCVAALHAEQLAATLGTGTVNLLEGADVLSSSSQRADWLVQPVDQRQRQLHLQLSLLQGLWGMLLQQHSWAALAAAVDGSAAKQQQQQGKQKVLQFLLGSAASGLLLKELQQEANASHAGTQAAAAAALTGVEALLQLPELHLPDPSEARQAFQALLYGTAKSDLFAGARQSSPLRLSVYETPAAALRLQRCLAFVNWCSYEVCLGQWDKAGQCLLAAVKEAVEWQQPQLIVLLQRQAMSLLVAMAKAEAAAGAAANAQQQQQQTAGLDGSGDVVMAEAAGTDEGGNSSTVVALPSSSNAAVSSLMKVLRAAFNPQQQQQAVHSAGAVADSSSKGSLPALQYPQLQFSSEQVVQRLQPAAMQPGSALLDAGELATLMAGLGRKQVRCGWGELGCSAAVGGLLLVGKDGRGLHAYRSKLC
jgi:hypothetical protein